MNNNDSIRKMIQEAKIRSLESSNKPNAMPSVPQMVRNVASETAKTVQSVLQGNPLKAEDKEAQSRKAICETCEFYNKAQERCTKCGCYMAVKVYLKASSCPVGKW